MCHVLIDGPRKNDTYSINRCEILIQILQPYSHIDVLLVDSSTHLQLAQRRRAVLQQFDKCLFCYCLSALFVVSSEVISINNVLFSRQPSLYKVIF